MNSKEEMKHYDSYESLLKDVVSLFEEYLEKENIEKKETIDGNTDIFSYYVPEPNVEINPQGILCMIYIESKILYELPVNERLPNNVFLKMEDCLLKDLATHLWEALQKYLEKKVSGKMEEEDELQKYVEELSESEELGSDESTGESEEEEESLDEE